MTEKSFFEYEKCIREKIEEIKLIYLNKSTTSIRTKSFYRIVFSLENIDQANTIIYNYINNTGHPSHKELLMYGILQLLYIQQDCIGEISSSLNRIKSSSNPASRKLRNKLVGHPISNKNDKNYVVALHPEQADDRKIKYVEKDYATGYFSTNEFDINEVILENYIFMEAELNEIIYFLNATHA